MTTRKVLNVSEARRELPRLLQEVSRGRGAVAIGPRGRAAAVLVGADEYDALRARALPLQKPGWEHLRMSLVCEPEDGDAALRDVRVSLSDSLSRRAESFPEPTNRRRGA